MQYWLIKSEPLTFSIENLVHAPKKTTFWDGVRNYQVRNMLRDQMRVNDQAFFYHSNCAVPGIVGVVEIVKAGYPDRSAFNPESKYYDPTSDPQKPRWYGVDVKFLRRLQRPIPLSELRTYSQLHEMLLLRKGNRLSITPLTPAEWRFILQLK
jgi:predicted RNA-binding protein with PUA-like domain